MQGQPFCYHWEVALNFQLLLKHVCYRGMYVHKDTISTAQATVLLVTFPSSH